jgi:DNA-binding GntR family transcriptional regulator
MRRAGTSEPVNLNAIALGLVDPWRGVEPETIPTAVDHAFHRIWRQIVSGELKPGDRLSDVELASKLGVSRTPVRQALHRLAQDELITFDPRRGFWVRDLNVDDIHELYEVRVALEVLALRRAAQNLDPRELHGLLEQVGVVRAELSDGTIPQFLEHDFLFHNVLIQASGNGRLIRTLATLRSQVSIFQIRDTEFPGRMERALDEHEAILNALLAGRYEDAADLLAAHIVAAKERVLADMFGRKEGAS